jgi:hypothetical protein
VSSLVVVFSMYTTVIMQLIQLESGQMSLSNTIIERVVSQLRNATLESSTLYGQDVLISYNLLMEILNFEIQQSQSGKTAALMHLNDRKFVYVSLLMTLNNK